MKGDGRIMGEIMGIRESQVNVYGDKITGEYMGMIKN
jgi:hypothetical protein